ncbi:MAG: energy transducer TonB [Pseudohongiellaceae bacterium]
MTYSDDDTTLSTERFRFTVFLSICFHAIVILGVGFTYSGESYTAPALEITLAQYRSDIEPDEADFLAQENQEGSGVLDEAAAPASPFVSDFHDEEINETRLFTEQPVEDVTELTTEQPLWELSDAATEQTQEPADAGSIPLLTADETGPLAHRSAAESGTAAPQPSQEPQVLNENTPPAELSLAIASLQAQLDLRREAYAKRPRRYTISSASARQSGDAEYLDSWRRHIEAVGNLNYPEEIRQQQIYGSLRLMVSLLPDGQVQGIRILQTSGHPLLDQAALRIVNLAAPFEPFPQEMRARADILEIIRTWRFHEGNALTSY